MSDKWPLVGRTLSSQSLALSTLSAQIAKSGNFCADSNRQTTDGQADHFNPRICQWGPGDSSFKCQGWT